MKTTAVLFASLIALTMACGGGSTTSGPGDAVTEMFAALKEGNGERVVSYMSRSALAGMEGQLESVQIDPEASSAQMAALGIQIDAADIPDMTVKDFAIAVFSSQMMASVMQSGEVSIGEVTIEGDVAKVEVTTTFPDRAETHIIDVVMEDGQWKVTEFGLNR
ncbi:MAG: nuclear transport factor 2 family protein [Candidatus Fermentibacteria bacterium]